MDPRDGVHLVANSMGSALKHTSCSGWKQTPLNSCMKESYLCKRVKPHTEKGTTFPKGENHYIKVSVN